MTSFLLKRLIALWNGLLDPEALEAVIDEKLSGTRRLLSRDMMQAIYRLGLEFQLIPVSGKTNEGIINLSSALERILVGGEKFTM